MDKKEYLIGDVASMIGISRDTLRFYERKGILSVRKKGNGYRYYTEDDIFELSSIFYHRKMNINLEKIENLWSQDTSYQSNAVVAEQKIQEEEEAIRRHQQALVRLRMFRDECKKIKQHLNRFSIRSFPDAYEIDTCATQQDGVIQWFYLSQKAPGLDMAYTYDTFFYSGTGDASALEFRHSTLLLYKQLANDLNISFDLESYPTTHTRDCLYTIVESPTRIPDIRLLDQMMAWGRDQGLTTEDTVISDYIMHGMKDGSFTFYLELYIPVSG